MTGRSLELYYIDGRPDGMLTAELFNWTGHVLLTPRTQIAGALTRPEAKFTGVYLLLGERDGEPRAYIGQGEDIAARIRDHDVKKDWWDTAVLVTASANKLNRAHVLYLEAKLILEAKAIGRVPLDNATSPILPTLSEADIAKMESFLECLFVVLPAVRVDMFIQRARTVHTHKVISQPTGPVSFVNDVDQRFILKMKDGFHAEAILNGHGEFVVLKGSSARGKLGPSSYSTLYDELERAGVIADANGRLGFVKDFAFKSPSAAASVATGRSANGAKDWKHAGTGESYKTWEAQKLGATLDQLLQT